MICLVIFLAYVVMGTALFHKVEVKCWGKITYDNEYMKEWILINKKVEPFVVVVVNQYSSKESFWG